MAKLYNINLKILLLSLLSLACGKESNPLEIKTFQSIPDKIDGCSSLFAATSEDLKESSFLYADNLEEEAFIFINGKLINFFIEDWEVQENGDFYRIGSAKDGYSFELTAQRTGQVDYLELFKATLEVKDAKGKSGKVSLVGECGC